MIQDEKHTIIFSLVVSLIGLTQVHAQSKCDRELIPFHKEKTLLCANKKGGLSINVSPADVRKFKEDGWVRYSDFGAVGDGKTDDADAIFAAHAFANQYNLMVKGDEGSTY